MKKDLVIFGIGKMAEVVYYYAHAECGYNVVGFAVDDEFKTNSTFQNLPVIEFSKVDGIFPPSSYDMFVAVGYQELNKLRERKCIDAMAKGYKLTSIISPLANLPSNVTVGWNSFIMPPALIHPCVKIGNNVFVWSGALIAHHSVIGDNCWLTSCCNVSGNVMIGANTFLAVNATIGHSVVVGKQCFLGANTLVTKNLEDEQVVIAESQKPLRLTSTQFLKISAFSSL